MGVKEVKPEDKTDDKASREALQAVMNSLATLSENDRHRVLKCAVEFFGVYINH